MLFELNIALFLKHRIENGLGTMGSELLGLGPRNIAVKDTLAWKQMNTDQKLTFWSDRIERAAPGQDPMKYARQFARLIKHGRFDGSASSNNMPRSSGTNPGRTNQNIGELNEKGRVLYFRCAPNAVLIISNRMPKFHICIIIIIIIVYIIVGWYIRVIAFNTYCKFATACKFLIVALNICLFYGTDVYYYHLSYFLSIIVIPVVVNS